MLRARRLSEALRRPTPGAHDTASIAIDRPTDRIDAAAAPDSPRFADSSRLLIAGLVERHSRADGDAAIPRQWQRFAAYLGRIPGQVGNVAYGTSYYSDGRDNIDYLCGVEVSDFSSVPRNFGLLCISPQRYAVFVHHQPVSSIRATWSAIWSKWLPDSGHEVANAPFFERYGAGFDPQTGTGGVEIWIPIVADAISSPAPQR